MRIRTKGGKVFDVERRIACMFGRIKATLESPSSLSSSSASEPCCPTAAATHSLSTLSLVSSSSSSCCCDSMTSGGSGSSSSSSATPASHAGGACPSNPTGLTCIKGPGENEVILDKTRGGIFALMIRWATHHRRDPAVTAVSKYRSCSGGGSLLDHSHAGSASAVAPPPALGPELPSYDQKFFSKLTRSQLFEMLQNASYLQLQLLTEMLAKTIANQLKGKSIEDIRSEFGIASDYTPQEEQAIKEDTERFLRRLRGNDCDTDGEDGCSASAGDGSSSIRGTGKELNCLLEAGGNPHAALLNKCEAEMTESERIAFAHNIIPLLNSLHSFSS